MAVRALTDDEKSELREQFTNIDKDESGYVIILIHNKGTVTSVYFRITMGSPDLGLCSS
jgi:hypothetical protein